LENNRVKGKDGVSRQTGVEGFLRRTREKDFGTGRSESIVTPGGGKMEKKKSHRKRRGIRWGVKQSATRYFAAAGGGKDGDLNSGPLGPRDGKTFKKVVPGGGQEVATENGGRAWNAFKEGGTTSVLQ